MIEKTRLYQYWKELYPDYGTEKLDNFLQQNKPVQLNRPDDNEWYKDAVIYSLYVDLFAGDIAGLTNKLDYLQDLGVNCLWLLPVLDSPMRDAGFDIRNYDRIRADLLGLPESFTKEEQERVFGNFLQEAHNRDIRVIFDVAINHTSEEHPWFQESKKSEDNPYRDYYIWSKTGSEYADARIIFKGIEESNWQKEGDAYFVHRFFNFQPDLNYKNPDVLLAMSRNLLYWQSMGVDGFRADAIPYLWKEEGTTCENLPKTHTVVKFFRAILDYVKPGSLLLAEACQQPNEVVKYLGDGDECHAAYHFPLMPQMFKALAMESGDPVKQILNPKVTPSIPESAQWFTFLRLHDELSLELVYVSEADRKYIHDNYCHQPQWDFRIGEGISARLAELMKREPDSIALAYSLMLTLIGTPVVYYGDEFGKLNDESFYEEMIKLTGKDDTRFLVRGRIDWQELKKELQDKNSYHARVYNLLKPMINLRRQNNVFGRGTTTFVDLNNPHLLTYQRQFQNETVLVINNLSYETQQIDGEHLPSVKDLLFQNNAELSENRLVLQPRGFAWMRI
jgi:maltose alpha-D-glucosyltransferase/alpha-amylase